MLSKVLGIVERYLIFRIQESLLVKKSVTMLKDIKDLETVAGQENNYQPFIKVREKTYLLSTIYHFVVVVSVLYTPYDHNLSLSMICILYIPLDFSPHLSSPYGLNKYKHDP